MFLKYREILTMKLKTIFLATKTGNLSISFKMQIYNNKSLICFPLANFEYCPILQKSQTMRFLLGTALQLDFGPFFCNLIISLEKGTFPPIMITILERRDDYGKHLVSAFFYQTIVHNVQCKHPIYFLLVASCYRRLNI